MSGPELDSEAFLARVRARRLEAIAAGDEEQADLCDAALRGSMSARIRCAQAMRVDTDPPPPAPETAPLPDDEDDAPASVDIPPIAAGEAEERVSLAFAELFGVWLRAEATAIACARALDQTAKGGP